MRIKICGITQPQQAEAIAQMGVAALGFICVPQSPRYLTPHQIGAIGAGLNGDAIDRVGVFVDATLTEIQATVALGRLNGVQLHGSESPQFCDQVRQSLPDVTVIKAFRVRDPATLAQTVAYQSRVDALLLDAYYAEAAHPGQYGGTGHTIAWEMLQNFRPACPWFLAGGITPDNVLTVLQQVTPDGLDLSSGVEIAPGNKDVQKVAVLMQQIQALKLCWP